MFFDTHAHVHAEAFDADLDATLARARDAGVRRILTVGCDMADSERALKAALHHGLDWSLGIHPHEAKDAPTALIEAFDALTSAAPLRPRAIGETGLDYYYDHSPRQTQRHVLLAQLAYAQTHGYPVIFHLRDAFDDFVAIMREVWSPARRGVMHCFTGDAAQADILTREFGLLLGIGGVVTFKTAEALREAVLAAGLESVILETDCPYLAPVPYRGKRNEPAFVSATATRLAQLFGLPPEVVAQQTWSNAEALFGSTA